MKINDKVKFEDFFVYLNKSKTLIISDLQLGYEGDLIQSGIFVPANNYDNLIKRIEKTIKKIKPKKIIINGDLKHEFGRISRHEWREVRGMLDFLKSKCETIIVKGNHDNFIGPLAKKQEIEVADYKIIDDYLICHGDKVLDVKEKYSGIIIGHEHPAISISDGSFSEKYKCFLVGKFKTKELIVQPSSFLLNLGTDITKYSTHSPFIDNIKDFEVYVLSDKIFDFGKFKDINQINK